MLHAIYTRISELHDVDEIPYIGELVDSLVRRMCNNISVHENPLIRAMRRAKHRNIFLGVQQENTGIT